MLQEIDNPNVKLQIFNNNYFKIYLKSFTNVSFNKKSDMFHQR